MQSGIMGFFLQPLEMIIALIGDILKNILGGLSEISAFFSFFRSAIQNIISSIYGIFFNATLQIVRVILMVKDVLHRLVATFFSIGYIMQSIAYSGVSLAEASNQVLANMAPPGAAPPPKTAS